VIAIGRAGAWLALLLLNGALSAVTPLMAPAEPRFTDRGAYEHVGKDPFAPNCGVTIYCYRVLVPALLEQVPIEPDTRWRTYRWAANTAAGAVIAGASAAVVTGASPLVVGVLVTVIVQTSFGFAFTAYDPYSAEPMVYLLLAVLTWCWFSQRWFVALAIGMAGVFAKETVALMSGALALAALVARRHGWRLWIAQAAAAGATLLLFHWIMDTYWGWGMSSNAAAKLSQGSWLALWWNNNPGWLRKLTFLFMPFGFAWLYAAAGYRLAPPPLRHLAIGAALPFLALNYLQNPERALSNLFFVVAPLAAVLLARVPAPVALAAVVTNGLLTATTGSGSVWMPEARYLFVLAAIAAAWVLWSLRGAPAAGHDTIVESS